jgi:transcriptional regulator with XRE-family HTH domain
MLGNSDMANNLVPMPEVNRGGAMLKALRQREGMTQKALAGAVGVPQSHISDFEKNRRAVPYKYAQKLAGLLHTIPSHFMTPNAETITAMDETFENGRKKYDNLEAMYKDMGI